MDGIYEHFAFSLIILPQACTTSDLGDAIIYILTSKDDTGTQDQFNRINYINYINNHTF